MERESCLAVSTAAGKEKGGREGRGSPEGPAAGGGPRGPQGLAVPSSPGTAPRRASYNSRQGFLSFGPAAACV